MTWYNRKASALRLFCFVFSRLLILFVLFTVYPMVNGLYLSFFEWSGASADKAFVGLKNYVKLLNDPIIPRTIWHDYFLVLTKVVGIMVLATFFAVALTQLRIKESPFYRVIFFFPNIMSVVCHWHFVVVHLQPRPGDCQLGIEGHRFGRVGAPVVRRRDVGTAQPGVTCRVGGHRLVYADDDGWHFERSEDAVRSGQDRRRERVAAVLARDRASHLAPDQNSILYIVITTLNGSFILVQVMTQGGPNNATQVMGSYLYQQAFKQYNFGYGATIGVMILILSLVTVLVLQFFLRRERVQY